MVPPRTPSFKVLLNVNGAGKPTPLRLLGNNESPPEAGLPGREAYSAEPRNDGKEGGTWGKHGFPCEI
jgi:hypothetical protein